MSHLIKLHRPVAISIISCLQEIIGNKKSADKVLEKCFKTNAKLGSRDRAMIASNVYDIVRNVVRIQYCNPLMEWWQLLGTWLILDNGSLPEWPEFNALNKHSILSLNKLALQNPALRLSIPEDLDELGKKELGDKWYPEMASMHQAAPMVLRVNTLKSNQTDICQILKKESIQHSIPDGSSEAIIIQQRVNIFKSEIFQNGWIEIQDYASQQVAHFVNPQPGERIIDACAGGGGKSLHMACRMKNKGRIIAMDIENYKLDNLKKRVKRAGVDIIEGRWIENSKVIKRLKGSADKVLIDAPCTGSGVLKRNPDAKYRINAGYLEELVSKQKEILDQYADMTKPGGELIYVTCSLFPSENQKQLSEFLATHAEFRVVEEKNLYPSEFGYDGFYMAKMIKYN